MNRKLNNDIFEIKTLSEIQKYTNSSSLVLLSTFSQSQTPLYQSFLNYSKTAGNVDFLSCTTDECVKEYNQDIILFKNFDEKINKYSIDVGKFADAKPDSVKEFVGTYGFETGAILNETHISMLFEHKKKMLFYFRNSSIKEQVKYDKIIKELGKDFRKRQIYTVVCDIKGNPLYDNLASTFIVLEQDLPALLFFDELAYTYTLRKVTNKELNKDYIKDYVDKILNGEIKLDLYSEPPLENYNINGLKYVIGRTYDKDVIEETKNVFIALIIGALESNETDRMLDIMRNLNKKYNNSEEKQIVFAYCDAGKNQPRDINLSGEDPPVVLLYTNSMSEKKIIRMVGNFTEITEKDVEDFLSENLNWGNKMKDENKGQKKESKQETDL